MAATKIGGVVLAGVLAGAVLAGAQAAQTGGAQTAQTGSTQTGGAQTGSPFGGFKHDRTAPIEITSDALEVHQAENLAIFTGDVVAGQADLRLTADRLDVYYTQQASDNPGTGDIKNMQAHGNVFISNGTDTAQGEEAEYNVETGIITMTGSVVLTQGKNVISGKRLTINVDEGQGRMEGRVKSIFTPQKKNGGGTD